MISTTRVREMENELRMWWQIAKAANRLARHSTGGAALREYRDEAEAIALHSTWPRLKLAVSNSIDRYDAKHPEWRLDCASSG